MSFLKFGFAGAGGEDGGTAPLRKGGEGGARSFNGGEDGAGAPARGPIIPPRQGPVLPPGPTV
jgi:hypothetical protein